MSIFVFDVGVLCDSTLTALAGLEEAIVNEEDIIASAAGNYPDDTIPAQAFTNHDDLSMYREIYIAVYREVSVLLYNKGIKHRPEFTLVKNKTLVVEA